MTEPRPIDRAWMAGVATGGACARLMIGTSMQGHALAVIARHRDDAVYGRTLDAVLRDFYVRDEDRRIRRAFASGVLYGWAEGTAERADSVECTNCSLRVLTDLEDCYRCDEHGWTCSVVCRDEVCRLPRCDS